MRSIATKRFSSLLLGSLGFTSIVFAGCQRSVNPIGGPFAPAGSSAPITGTGPLIPLGPMTGGTRVPPPSTGSSNLDNSYSATGPVTDGKLSMSDVVGSGTNSYVSVPTNSFRDSLGGMPIQDLSAQLSSPRMNTQPMSSGQQPYVSTLGDNRSNSAVGSGLATMQPGPVSLASATSFASPSLGANAMTPADRMRPIETGYSVTPPPRYRAIESSISTPQPSPVQSVVSGSQIDSWESPSTNNSNAGVANAVYSSPKQPASSQPTIDQPLPWRSPTLAR